jgi:hypothetical protein
MRDEGTVSEDAVLIMDHYCVVSDVMVIVMARTILTFICFPIV